MKCLVVDPSPTMTRIVRNILRAAGAEVVLCARDPASALGLLDKQKQPGLDLVVTELDLGGEDGLELVATVRAREGLDRTSAILVTARNSRSDVLQAVQAGIDAYVLKPLDQEALLAHATAVLAARASRGEDGASSAATKDPGAEASVAEGDEPVDGDLAEADEPAPAGEDEERRAA